MRPAKAHLRISQEPRAEGWLTDLLQVLPRGDRSPAVRTQARKTGRLVSVRPRFCQVAAGVEDGQPLHRLRSGLSARSHAVGPPAWDSATGGSQHDTVTPRPPCVNRQM